MSIWLSKHQSSRVSGRSLPDDRQSYRRVRDHRKSGGTQVSLLLCSCLVLAVILGLTAAVSTSGCGKKSAKSASAKEGGLLRIGTAEGIDSLNMFVAYSADAYGVSDQIYPRLVQYDMRTLDFVPDFATSWTISPDARTLTFQTRPNAKWSDGHPLTAADVAWTCNTIVKFAKSYTGIQAGGVANLERASAPSATTLVLHYTQPSPSALAKLQNIPILPEHVWGSYATGNGAQLKSFPNTPSPGHPVVSGGPFMCVKYTQNQVAVFQRNPNYYGPRPHIDGFGLQTFSNQDAMISALKDGQIDAIQKVPTTAVSTLKTAGFDVYTGPSMTSRVFIFNSNPKKTTHRELLNPQLREAFEYAVDRNEIIKTAWLGFGEPGTTLVPPATPKWHDSSIKPLPFDLAKANQLLDQAGYTMGPNGVRIADGHPMHYVVIFPSDQSGAGDRAFQIIQSGFAKIGVQLVQKTLDPVAANTAIMAPDGKYLTFDLAMWWWVPVVDPSFVLGEATTAQYGIWNDSGYSNPAYDRLFQQFTITVDPAERVRLAYEMQQMIYNARVYIVINYNDTIDAWSNKWTGFVEGPDGFFTTLSIQCLTSVHQL